MIPIPHPRVRAAWGGVGIKMFHRWPRIGFDAAGKWMFPAATTFKEEMNHGRKK